MKSTVNEKTSEEEAQYPCLMKGSGELVLLMTSKDIGTVVSANAIYDIGEHCSDWGGLKPFHGTVTLED